MNGSRRLKIHLGIVFLLLLFPSYLTAQSRYTISGHVSDEKGEMLIGVNIYTQQKKIGAVTNDYGFYSLSLPQGKYVIVYSYLGYETQQKEINLTKDIMLDINLHASTRNIESVEVKAERRDANVERVEMSTNKLPMKTIKQLPVIFGETDVIKTLQLLPGVQMASEASGGFHVRGGNVDQNLILLDDAPVYNSSHALGFFSVFNGDAIKDIKLYKGGIPAEYGGRLSSILDIRMKDGSDNQYGVSGGIGLISSRLEVEGPLVKDKSSFFISGRRTYADLFLPLAKDSLAKKSKLYFYDLNTKINFRLNEKNRVYLSGYFGRDVVKLGDLISLDYGNATGTLRWNHLFSSKLFLNTTLVYTNFHYNLVVDEDLMKVDWITDIIDLTAKTDLTWFLSPANTIKFGIGTTYHDLNPGLIDAKIDTVPYHYDLPDNYALEHGIYLENKQELSGRLSLEYGIRLSVFQNMGKSRYYLYDKSNPLRYEITDTIKYDRGKLFNTYTGWEPRLAVRYKTGASSSVKASYNRMYQYIHLASNSTNTLPINEWFPSSPNIKPQVADQVAVGYFQNFKHNVIETSVEAYYKKIHNAIDFRDHAELVLNDRLEGELRIGEAYAYGIEFMVKKPEGRLNGWVSYTYSRSIRKIPEINNGEKYPASYDRPNDISVVLSYNLTDRINISADWVYSTAVPRTMPTGRFEYEGMIAPVYSDRNGVRIFDYHRLDLSVTLYNKKKLQKHPRKDGKPRGDFESNWNFSIYNVYARKNPVLIQFKQSDLNSRVTEASIVYLYSIVPSVTYNFKF